MALTLNFGDYKWIQHLPHCIEPSRLNLDESKMNEDDLALSLPTSLGAGNVIFRPSEK